MVIGLSQNNKTRDASFTFLKGILSFFDNNVGVFASKCLQKRLFDLVFQHFLTWHLIKTVPNTLLYIAL